MNKQELIGKIRALPYEEGVAVDTLKINRDGLIKLIEQFDEPQSIKLKDVIARIKELDLGAREVWLNEILNELGSDYGSLKYRAGYEQGRFDSAVERAGTIIPQLVADWIEVCKEHLTSSLYLAMTPSFLKENNQSFELILWIKKKENQDAFARAWLYGYEVEKEKRYRVKAKGVYFNTCLIFEKENKKWLFSSIFEINHQRIHHTHKELEEAGFGEVFNSPLFELEEVE